MLQRADVPTADLLLARMRAKIGDLCRQRDALRRVVHLVLHVHSRLWHLNRTGCVMRTLCGSTRLPEIPEVHLRALASGKGASLGHPLARS